MLVAPVALVTTVDIAFLRCVRASIHARAGIVGVVSSVTIGHTIVHMRLSRQMEDFLPISIGKSIVAAFLQHVRLREAIDVVVAVAILILPFIPDGTCGNHAIHPPL